MIKPLDSYHHVPHAPLPHVLDSTNIREIQVLCWVGHENCAITNLLNKYNNLSMHIRIWLAENTTPWLWLVRGRCLSVMSQWVTSAAKSETKANKVVDKAIQLWEKTMKKTGKRQNNSHKSFRLLSRWTCRNFSFLFLSFYFGNFSPTTATKALKWQTRKVSTRKKNPTLCISFLILTLKNDGLSSLQVGRLLIWNQLLPGSG